MNPPRVFVSYSHDSAEHKKWVLDFATTLRNRGIDAIIDQWDLKPGDDLPHFMETQLSTAEHVIMICSKKYVDKANAGEGGVGYEKMILTSNLLSKIDNTKIVPVVRQKGSNLRPTFLQTKLYVDFSIDSEIEYSFDELIRHLLDAPLFEKPPIGNNPFKPMENSRPDRASDGIKSVMDSVAGTYNTTSEDYISFSALTRHSKMHRLTLERYLGDAIKSGLVSRNDWLIKITPKGLEYLVEHELIE
jgi:hypothetical protein|tara:strand:- start:475 stop:1212 length:738 start_codon:yes stop_codon:yes gene_type:complete